MAFARSLSVSFSFNFQSVASAEHAPVLLRTRSACDGGKDESALAQLSSEFKSFLVHVLSSGQVLTRFSLHPRL
jgi:hypothetical protein